jgi:hypothetical protein
VVHRLTFLGARCLFLLHDDEVQRAEVSDGVPPSSSPSWLTRAPRSPERAARQRERRLARPSAAVLMDGPGVEGGPVAAPHWSRSRSGPAVASPPLCTAWPLVAVGFAGLGVEVVGV